MLHCDEYIAAMTFCKGQLPESKLHHSLIKTQSNTMAKVPRRAQKYINLEEKLEARWLRKIANFDRKVSDDLRMRNEANKASQWRDPSGHNNARNNVKDPLDPFKQFSLSVPLTQMVNYLEGKKFIRWPRKITSYLSKRNN